MHFMLYFVVYGAFLVYCTIVAVLYDHNRLVNVPAVIEPKFERPLLLHWHSAQFSKM